MLVLKIMGWGVEDSQFKEDLSDPLPDRQDRGRPRALFSNDRGCPSLQGPR